jgi:hypothetical protein
MKKAADFPYYVSKFLADIFPGGRCQSKYNPVIQGHFFAVHKILQVARKYASGEDDARTADKGTSMRVSLLARK